MATRNSPSRHAALAAHEGLQLLSAHEILVKSALESETRIALIAGPRHDPFGPVFDIAATPEGAELLFRHETRMLVTPDAGRAIRLALHSSQAGRKAMALIPNSQLDQTTAVLMQTISESPDSDGAACLVLEDHPELAPASCPRRAAMRLGIACLEATDLRSLGESVDYALRLSRADHRPIGLVVHTSLLRSADTLEVQPNRVPAPTDVILPRRRASRPRWGQSGGVLRTARRLELNRFRAIPNPGERIPLGFITVGPADPAMHHIARVFKLQGRIPVLQLGLVYPLDDAAVARLLLRCEQAVVLEPRPGTIELSVLRVAESLRRTGERPSAVWGRQLPPDESGRSDEMESDEDLHPSVLVRKISHLLQALRSGAEIQSVLLPDPPTVSVRLQPRTAVIGSDAVLAVVRGLLANTERWLADEAPIEDRNLEASTLSIDGHEPVRLVPRVVQVETWGHRRFQIEGLSALMQAANDDRPWLLVVCETTQESTIDFERLARSAVPADRASRVRIDTGNLDDQNALEELLREAALSNGLTVVIVRDGPPARYDVDAIEQAMQSIDRLGFQPTQRLVRPIELACSLRLGEFDQTEERLDGREPKALETSVSVEQQTRRGRSGIRSRLRPLFEQIEVIRTRPPARIWRHAVPSRLPLPQPLHGRQPQWRVHLAGYRSRPPGVAAMVLSEAGRIMGYAVQSIYRSTPIGAGRRAWAELLFTQGGRSTETPELAATIPYGEADLLLGLDVLETFRAIGPDASLRVADTARTCAVVNLGYHQDEPENDESDAIREQLRHWLQTCTWERHQFTRDFAKACRRSFGSDRITDIALLGASFQLGYIPVTFDALNEALQRLEGQGYGSIVDAFEFGRRLVLNPNLFARQKDEREEGVHRIARRLELMLARSGWGGRSRARRFRGLVDRSLKAMPGLAESDAGRRVRRFFVIALYRCAAWGGFDYAERYAELIIQLYHADRGDLARLITRHAILPVADVMLIRDPFYVASMVGSPAQRRRTRKRLNVRLARGDRLEFRYLTRYELIMKERRLRIDIRSSDWAARLVAAMRIMMPQRWRGIRRERDLREFVVEFVRRATLSKVRDYHTASAAFQTLHQLATDDRLRHMSADEVQRLLDVSFIVEGETPSEPSEPAAP